ncbi:DUF2264 domain-containing protein [Spirosoma utsteinense]|uniref:DUF2264 domain-containing protein n=1 Tax=Spirosoma utsteinense TaxID=2585773 RepID=A0ABR6W2D0_9BACT|nr:DUF2264 domain-containing protein [Spirosoma utsteinense]MBC3786032.1 hypothetical protein [Spirosoma utsteinense]MBC3790730.1 hypothetical protein [Spirosoma utsteinense]
MNRRSFTRLFSALSWTSATGSVATLSPYPASAKSVSGADDRTYWTRTLVKVAEPVLSALAQGRLKATMPVESAPGQRDSRVKVSYLEALGRTLAGLAPWLEASTAGQEQVQQQRLADLARQAITKGVDPASPDYLNFTEGGQPLVDAAFLAHALLRAPVQLWSKLDKAAQANLIQALQASRTIKPGYNNWLLFSAMVEAALLKFTGSGDEMRMDYAIREHMAWYKGDGAYGDGPDFHWDYYNSFVIQPMLLDIVQTLVQAGKADKALYETVLVRARRYAIVQERLIGPDGSFAAFGRSLAYRCGAFQLLAQVALQNQLPPELTAGQVRNALTAVIRRTMEAPNTFDKNGWLQIGLCGHQPSIGETYISTGSLYLCSVAFLPLGLPAADPFWTAAGEDWTAKKIWGGQDVKPDHAVKG